MSRIGSPGTCARTRSVQGDCLENRREKYVSSSDVLKREKCKRTMKITNYILLQVGICPTPIKTAFERPTIKNRRVIYSRLKKFYWTKRRHLSIKTERIPTKSCSLRLYKVNVHIRVTTNHFFITTSVFR